MPRKRSLPLLLILLCWLQPQASQAQQALYDSLLNVHHNQSLADSTRRNALISLSESNYRREQPDSLVAYLEAATALFQKSKTAKDSSEHFFYLGNTFYYGDKYYPALNYLNKAIAIAQPKTDTIFTIKILARLGSTHLQLGTFSSAVEHITEALTLAEILQSERYINSLRSNLGLVYLAFEEFEKARQYLEESLAYSQATGNQVEELRALTNIGVSYYEENNNAESLKHHLLAYDIVEQLELWRFAGTVLLNIGECYHGLDELGKAGQYYHRGLHMARTNKETPAVARGLIQMAHFHRKTQPDSAFIYAQNALELSEELGNLAIIENAKQILHKLYEDRGQYREALDMYKEWKEVLDSMYSAESQQTLYQAEARYEYEKQQLAEQITFEQEIAQEKLRSQRRMYVLLGGSLLAILGLLSMLKVRQDRSLMKRNSLLHEIEILKERVAAQSVVSTGVRKELALDKAKLETYLGTNLGTSSWSILNVIFKNPSVTNKAIAEEVFLSVEGVSSSLRRMYKSFDVDSDNSQNMKVALVTKAVKISLGEEE